MSTDTPPPADATLTLRRSDALDDWYVIERAEHDGSDWLEPIDGGDAYQCSARISDADVEGTAFEMRALATAIERRGGVTFGRCAVAVRDDDRVEFWSPRNSRRPGSVSLASAVALAEEVRRVLG